MALQKVTYTDLVTIIGAQNLNDIQDAIIALEEWQTEAGAAIPQILANIAPSFSNSTSYSAGDCVIVLNKLYQFTAAHPAGDWTGADATEVNVTSLLKEAVDSLSGDVDELNSAVTHLEANAVENEAALFEQNSYGLSGVYYGTVGSGTILQVRGSTSSYNGLIIPIPRGVWSIDLSDMTPYSVYAFNTFPVVGMTSGVAQTITNKVLSIPVDNAYSYILVTLKLSVSGNDKETYAISMHKTFDERIREVEQETTAVKSGKTLPIVCFIYDDNTSGDTTLHDMLEERGLKGTFATIGNIDKDDATWKETATRLQEWVRHGHGVVGHGLTRGVNVTILDGGSYAGISNISDADARKAIEANNAALDAYGLPHNGIAYWNVWEDNPHTRSIVEKYYNYGFTFGGAGAGVNTEMTDPFRLTRWATDEASHMADAERLVKESIGQNRLLVFGGHMNRTATGTGTYSTMAQFTSLLNVVRDTVKNGDMISLNADDAFRLYFGQKSNSGIAKDYPYRPAVGNVVYDGGMRVCTDSGRAAFYKVIFTGTPQNGNLTIPELSINVSVSSSDTISDVVNRIISGTRMKNYTLERSSASEIYAYCDKAGVMPIPTVQTNTSGLTVSIVLRQEGVDPVWSKAVTQDEMLENLYKAYATDTASGAIASFPDGADDIPVKDLSVGIEPVQSGSGDPSPDNVRPISGWTGANVALAGKNLLRLIESEMVTSGWNRRFPFFIKAGTYRISCQNQFGAADDKLGVRLNWIDKNGTVIKDAFPSYEFGNATMQSQLAFTESMAEQIAYIEIRPRATGMTYKQIADAQIMLELGSTATDYEPYAGDTYSITFPSEAGTVYGGTLDVTTGKLTVDRAMVDMGTLTWRYQSGDTYPCFMTTSLTDAIKVADNSYKANALCSMYKIEPANDAYLGRASNCVAVNSTKQVRVYDTAYTDVTVFTAAMNGVQFCYELAAPVVYDLTPTEVRTLLAQNNIWADCGDSTVEYRADTKLYIDKKIAAIPSVPMWNGGSY